MRVYFRALLWVSAACIFALTGCAKQEPRLTFMTGGTPNEFIFWQALCDDFESETGIRVDMIRSTTQTGQRKQQIQVGLRGRRPDPDLFTMDIAWIGQLAHSEWLEPLGPYGVDASACFSNVIALADTYNGDLVGVPLWIDAGLLYYRTDLLQKYGYDAPPRTWDELVTMSRTVQAGERPDNPEFWGYVWQGAQYEGLVCNALEVFASAGGGFFNDQGAPVLDSDANARALRFMVALIHDAAVSPPNVFTDMQEEEARLMFQNGDALFERNWPYAMELHGADDSSVRDRFGVTVLPHFGGHASAATLGGWHVGLSRFADRKEDAAAFIRYLASYEVQKRLAVEHAHNPARVDVYDDEDVREMPIAQLKPVFRAAIPRPPVPYYPDVSTILQKHVNAALAKKVTPRAALRDAQKQVRDLLEELTP